MPKTTPQPTIAATPAKRSLADFPHVQELRTRWHRFVDQLGAAERVHGDAMQNQREYQAARDAELAASRLAGTPIDAEKPSIDQLAENVRVLQRCVADSRADYERALNAAVAECAGAERAEYVSSLQNVIRLFTDAATALRTHRTLWPGFAARFDGLCPWPQIDVNEAKVQAIAQHLDQYAREYGLVPEQPKQEAA